MSASPAAVTPSGVRDGDPQTLRALCERRGPAVLAYCEQVCAPGEAIPAAADAFARFRAAVAAADQPAGLDAERLLLSGTRHAAAARAPRVRVGTGLARRLGVRSGSTACELVPELLVARAEHRLSEADEQRLDRHLERCTACHATARRFRAAQAAYADPPRDDVPDRVAEALVGALATAAPVNAEPPVEPRGDAMPAKLVPPDAEDVTATDARLASGDLPPEIALQDTRDEGAEDDADLPAADLAEETPLAMERDPAEPAIEDDDFDGLAESAVIAIRGRPEGALALPEMPAAIAPPPGYVSRRPNRGHGRVWGLLLPAAVLVAALVAVLALAGVFSRSTHRAAATTARGLAVPAGAAGATHAAITRHHARRHRAATHSRRARHVRSSAAARRARARISPPAAVAPSSSPAAPVASTPPASRHSSPPPSGAAPHTQSSTPTTVKAVGPPSSAAPPSTSPPSTGGTGYQPSGGTGYQPTG